MRTTVFSLLLFGTVCGLSGCTSKPVETPSAAAEAMPNPGPQQPPVAEVKPVKVPAQSPAPAAKPSETPAPPAAHKETKIEPKEEDNDNKPREMKAANDLDRNPFLSSSLKPLLPPRATVPN